MSAPDTTDPSTPRGARSRSKFSWGLVDPAVRARLADVAGVSDDVDSVAAAFGSPPRADRFAVLAPVLRDAWLPTVDPRVALSIARAVAKGQRGRTPMTPPDALASLGDGKRLTNKVLGPLRDGFLAVHQVRPDGSSRNWLPDRVQPDPASRLPTQVATWMHFNVGDGSGDSRSEGAGSQELYAPRDTQYGERQLVWEGGTAAGVIGFVDFAGLPHSSAGDGVFWDWGAFTRFERPVTVDDLAREPLLRGCFSGALKTSLQGRPFRWSPEEGEAFGRAAAAVGQPLPPVAPPIDLPDGGTVYWTGLRGLPPEARAELDVQRLKRNWKRVGFRRQPDRQLRMSEGDAAVDIPDLLGPVKGGGSLLVEVKRAVTATDGPAQLQRYLERMDRQRPDDGPWRGAFLHCHDGLSPSAKARIAKMDRPIDVWGFVGDPDDGWKLVHVWSSEA